MTERSLKMHIGGGGGSKPISMKLFAIGDVGRMPPFCSSRICSARLIRLVIMRPLEEGLHSCTIAIKMQGSKRTLRSTEIELGGNGTLDTEIDLSLSLQYPHYLKQRTNLLYIMLQRRKKYKNRRILGYKTLAVGTVDMTEVLQRSLDQELLMYANPKDKDATVARITIVALSTQPVNLAAGKESLEDENTSDEDEFTSEMSDSEGDAVADEALGHGHGEGSSSKSRRKLQAGRQANFKQKFISLLRKFKASDGFDADVPELEGHDKSALDDELLDELDFDSDSGPDFFDNISVQSTPRPHLSPYFKAGRSLSTLLMPPTKNLDKTMEKSDEGSRNNSDSHPDTLTDEDGSALRGDDQRDEAKRKRMLLLREKSSSVRDKEVREKLERRLEKEKEVVKQDGARKFSQSIPIEPSPKKALMDQLSQIFPSPEDDLPSSVVLINGNHSLGGALQKHLQAVMPPVICTASTGDLKGFFTQLANRLHKVHFGKALSAIRIVMCGGDEYVNAVLRAYVELFTDRPSDLHASLRFVFIPLGESALARYVGQTDSFAGELFDQESWYSIWDVKDAYDLDWEEIVTKISLYCQEASTLLNLPVAQAMINVKSHGLAEAESSQMFIPFLSDVRISAAGSSDLSTAAPSLNEGEEAISHLHNTPSSASFVSIPAGSGAVSDMQQGKSDFSPPHSPSVAQTLPIYSLSAPISGDAMELQLDFWTLGGANEDKEKERERKKSDVGRAKDLPSSKTSIKAAFRSIYVVRPVQGGNVFALTYSTKEKKIQIMRALGKKARDLEVRTVVVDGVSRLICRICKVHGGGMKVAIDGCDWPNINFFQLSPHWHSSVKSLPLFICRKY